jgi:phenylpropionate dioxygenase-like ring-hydroxylating dioxygenase large terminal subunit
LADIEPAMTGFDLEQAVPVGSYRYEAKANWKLVAGLSHEAYHFATVHRDSLASLMYDKAVVDTFGRHTRWAFAFRGAEKLADQDTELWPGQFPGAMNHTLFPGTVIVVNNDDAEMIRVEPGSSPGESVIYYSGVSRRPDNLEACREAFEFGGKLFTEEDLPAAEASQRGLAAGLQSVIVGRNEPVVQFWHELWNHELQGSELAQ